MTKYRFDEIAINSTQKKKPTEEDKVYYIGLEHIDPGCFDVVRWGSDVAPTGDKLLMQRGMFFLANVELISVKLP